MQNVFADGQPKDIVRQNDRWWVVDDIGSGLMIKCRENIFFELIFHFFEAFWRIWVNFNYRSNKAAHPFLGRQKTRPAKRVLRVWKNKKQGGQLNSLRHSKIYNIISIIFHLKLYVIIVSMFIFIYSISRSFISQEFSN